MAAAVIQVIFPGSAHVIFFVDTIQFLIITPGGPRKSKFAPKIPATAEFILLQETEPPNQQSVINEAAFEVSHCPIKPPTVSQSSPLNVLTTFVSEAHPFICVSAVH